MLYTHSVYTLNIYIKKIDALKLFFALSIFSLAALSNGSFSLIPTVEGKHCLLAQFHSYCPYSKRRLHLKKTCVYVNVSKYDKEIPQLHTEDQPTTL